MFSGHTRAEATANALDALNAPSSGGVPDAPFKKTWPELALKRMLRYAAENGYDKLTWTTGEQQADRYDLSKQVHAIDYARAENGDYELRAFDRSGTWHDLGTVSPDKLAEHVGKDAAQRIVDGVGHEVGAPEGSGSLKGVDLKVGGEGMRGFYDKILPRPRTSSSSGGAGGWGRRRSRPGNRVMMFMGLEISYLHRASRWMRQRVVDGMPRVVNTLLNHLPQAV